MSLLTKAIITAIFIGLFVTMIYLLPTNVEYPLPTEFTSSLALIIGYTFAWAQVFTWINVLFLCALTALAIEILIWIWKVIAWTISKVAPFLA